MRTYEYRLLIVEGSDEFWESLNGTGCEEITEQLESCLYENGFLVNHEDSQNKLTLVRYSNN